MKSIDVLFTAVILVVKDQFVKFTKREHLWKLQKYKKLYCT